jgi:hypothetical protein
MRKGAFVMFVIAAMLVAGTAAAGDWQKLGRKTVSFNGKEQAVSITAKGEPVSQVAFKFGGDWMHLTQVTINFDDGSSQAIEDLEDVRPGMTSEGYAIEGGPKKISSIDISYRAARPTAPPVPAPKVAGPLRPSANSRSNNEIEGNRPKTGPASRQTPALKLEHYSSRASLPNLHAFLWREVHRVPFLHIK